MTTRNRFSTRNRLSTLPTLNMLHLIQPIHSNRIIREFSYPPRIDQLNVSHADSIYNLIGIILYMYPQRVNGRVFI